MNQSECAGCKMGSLTLTAVGLTLLYVIFMFVTGIMVRWWVMLPLGFVAFFLFRMQRGQTEGFEKKVCDWGYYVIIAGLVLRDACLSSRLAGIYGAVSEVAGEAAKTGLNL
ncbi:hypothetical protein [Desulfolutivibrio sulfoxidireducens]|uniref:hypothetical protein n=1 Tax=Desulfolutivibrio sulfoxidireducens TaxID=2773299 RepID=UPI00159D1681|nr:hypothetical protein [Desulfolutivibrio sulfoxidireducens]